MDNIATDDPLVSAYKRLKGGAPSTPASGNVQTMEAVGQLSKKTVAPAPVQPAPASATPPPGPAPVTGLPPAPRPQPTAPAGAPDPLQAAYQRAVVSPQNDAIGKDFHSTIEKYTTGLNDPAQISAAIIAAANVERQRKVLESASTPDEQAAAREKLKEFIQKRTDATQIPGNETTAAGAFSQSALRGVAPLAAGVSAGSKVTALTAETGPFALVFGLVSGVGAGIAASWLQDKAVQKVLGQAALDEINRQDARAAQEHPMAQKIGQSAPVLLAFKPDGKMLSDALGAVRALRAGATLTQDQATAVFSSVFGSGSMAALEGINQYQSGEFKPLELAAAGVEGMFLQGNRFGKPGQALAAARERRMNPNTTGELSPATVRDEPTAIPVIREGEASNGTVTRHLDFMNHEPPPAGDTARTTPPTEPTTGAQVKPLEQSAAGEGLPGDVIPPVEPPVSPATGTAGRPDVLPGQEPKPPVAPEQGIPVAAVAKEPIAPAATPDTGVTPLQKFGVEIGALDRPGFGEQIRAAAGNVEQQMAGSRNPKEGAVALPSRQAVSFAAGVKRKMANLFGPASRRLSPVVDAFTKWSAKRQLATLEARKVQDKIRSIVKSDHVDEAITNWLEVNGDTAELQRRAMATKDHKLRQGYLRAMNLTPEEIKLARAVRTLYDDLFAQAKAQGLIQTGKDAYVNHIWDRKAAGKSGVGASKLSTFFQNSMHSKFGSYFEGEQVGLKPATKKISELVPIYVNHMHNVVADRALPKSLLDVTMPDGRPAAVLDGIGSVVPGEGPASDNKGVILVRPHAKSSSDVDTHDYTSRDLPNNFAGWKWLATGDDGKQVLMKGNVSVHPDAWKYVKSAFGKSAIREWYDSPSQGVVDAVGKGIVKGADKLSAITKEGMFGLISPFHALRIGTEAVGHSVNPFNRFWRAPDPNDAALKLAVRYGVGVAPDHVQQHAYMEGVGGGGAFFQNIPLAGRYIFKPIQKFMFENYIPKIKVAAFDALFQRNLKTHAKAIDSGKYSIDDIGSATADQINATFGHQNYAKMGRDPTVQHLARLAFLAPDFEEAHYLRRTAQLVDPIAWKEQWRAIMTLATLQWTGSRMLNYWLDGDAHFDKPFSVVVGNREYSIRTAVSDLTHLFGDTYNFVTGKSANDKFVSGRLNPLLAKTAVQMLSGVNYRGERTDMLETMKEAASAWIPIYVRGVPEVRELTKTERNHPVSAMEQAMQAIGLHVGRYTATSQIYELAREYRKANNLGDDRVTYPTSQYQQLRYALEDNDTERARIEFKKIVDSTNGKRTKYGVMRGFHVSLFSSFTGSQAHDYEFRQSLSPENQKLFDAAIERKNDIWNRFRLMVTTDDKPGS